MSQSIHVGQYFGACYYQTDSTYAYNEVVTNWAKQNMELTYNDWGDFEEDFSELEFEWSKVKKELFEGWENKYGKQFYISDTGSGTVDYSNQFLFHLNKFSDWEDEAFRVKDIPDPKGVTDAMKQDFAELVNKLGFKNIVPSDIGWFTVISYG